MADYDVIVIGAGVSGCAVARELSRFSPSICVLDRDDDVCSGTSKANSAIVHAGFDAPTGSLMARLNVEGNRLMFELAEDLDFPCERIGSLVVLTSENERAGLDELLARGQANGVPGLRIIERDELRRMEPNISDAAVAALWAPSAGIVDPFGLTVALAENAATNGVTFRMGKEVTNVMQDARGLWQLTCSDGTNLTARAVVNAAGVYADVIHNLVAAPTKTMSITARKGEYYLLDTIAGAHVRHTVFMLPSAMGKGVLVTPTVHGNLLIGPTAKDVADKEATDTTAAGLAEIRSKASLTVRDLPLGEVITTFAGLRAHRKEHEFAIGELAEAPGFFDCAAIESPGLTSAPAIGRMLAAMVAKRLCLSERPMGEWVATRQGIASLERESVDKWAVLCEQDRRYGNIVCRCRHVSEAQIVDALHRNPQPRSLDALKRRTTAMMGRCQGGFCTPKLMEILEKELGISAFNITKEGGNSVLVAGTPKDRSVGYGKGSDRHE